MEVDLRKGVERRIVSWILGDVCGGYHPPRIPPEALVEVIGFDREACTSLDESLEERWDDPVLTLRGQELSLVIAAIEARLRGPYAYAPADDFQTLTGAWPEEVEDLLERLRGEPPRPPELVSVPVRTLVSMRRDVAMFERYLRRFTTMDAGEETIARLVLSFLRDVDAVWRLARIRETLDDAAQGETSASGDDR